MAATQIHDFTVAQGARWSEDLLYRLEDRTTVVDLTGYGAELLIRTEPGGDALATLSTSNGLLTIAAALGKISISVPTATTAAWDWVDPAVYRLNLIDSNGERDTILEGSVVLREWST